MTLQATIDHAVADDAVEFVFAVENADDEPVELTFRNGQTAEAVVFEDDVEVWRWSEGRLFTQATRTVSLAPGETIVEELVWESPSPGAFEVLATLEADAADVGARAAFEV